MTALWRSNIGGGDIELPIVPNPPGEVMSLSRSGTASYTISYAVTYTYDANNRLIGEAKDQGGTTTTSVYTYDDNGNLLTERDAANTAVATHSYDALNRLISSAVGAATTTYTYNPQGIRTSRTVGTTTTDYLLDGGNVVGEITGEAVTTYLRGTNLISNGTNYYLHNAHGDVTMLANASGAVVKNYAYDAFGNQLNTVAGDTNPFRYCGEYYDTETGNYYLRARYYDPGVGRFTQQDTHWNTANMIYGDTMQKLNVTVDAEGGEYFTAIPQLLAIRQAGNLYVYAANDPVSFADYSGDFIISTLALLMIGGAILGGTIGGILGYNAAGQAGLTGWDKAIYTTNSALFGGIIGSLGGYVLAPVVVSATGVVGVGTAAGAVETVTTLIPTGQFHHVLSNPIMRALNSHPTLHGLFDRSTSVVQALTPEAHRGYQQWHRVIDQTMVQWLTDPANKYAVPYDFWMKMYELYNTPDMVQRFGYGVLNYIIQELTK